MAPCYISIESIEIHPTVYIIHCTQLSFGLKLTVYVQQWPWKLGQGHENNCQLLTLKAPRKNASENAVCWSRLLQIIALHYRRIKYWSKQRGPRTDCSYSLIWVHAVCHRGFLNISADKKSRQLLLRLAHLGLIPNVIFMQFWFNSDNWFLRGPVQSL